MEHPESLRNTLRGRVLEEEGTSRLGGLNLTDEQLLQVNRIVFTACGTSWHSALIGEYMMEELARIPSEVEYASEFRYRTPSWTSARWWSASPSRGRRRTRWRRCARRS